ncbi:DnaJ domain-containing protein [Candidatus Gracilibacteria bacterium]|nr:DnaJ domain-containing protein [Candidatus Gracilibacteria bacterium]
MNHYQALGVVINASSEEIVLAFRRIAMNNHPDRNPNNEEAERIFYLAKSAYEVLGDPEKRKLYDREIMDAEVFDLGDASYSAFADFVNTTLKGVEHAGFNTGSKRKSNRTCCNIATTRSSCGR